ncbi:MAG: hypothetical protein HONBIEJF_02741 [Fimbriimonadaceae bacterium]|nr:hypothetical protein [Fimbriimonadaceae bacterium]
MAVLVGAGLAAAWLAVYVFLILPRRMSQRLQATVRVFGTAIELRIPHQQGLTEKVSVNCRRVGERLGLGRTTLERMEMAVRLRDIGLVAIPYKLLNSKPPEYWSPAEQAVWDRHPEVSGAMLELVPSLRHLAPIVRWHHGDYQPLASEFAPTRDQLPIESRIINICSAYSWLERHHGTAHARDIVLKASGKAFDPAVVDAFMNVITSSRDAERLPKVVVG